MRRFIVLIALLGLMLGLRLLQSENTEQQSALVLAAIGFVLLASFTVAEMGSVLTLPRVTGYILTGALLAAFGILSPPVVLEMKMFNTLALGLIAISAGLELSLAQLKKVIGTLSATIVAKMLLAVPLVGAAFFLYERYMGPLSLGSFENISAVALVMGALALGTSPAIALAIISETKSRGRLSDIILGASVLKDLVVVVALAVAVAVARGLVATGDEGSSSLLHVFIEIGYSILAGGILGTLLILYIRYIRAEMLLFVAAMILVVAEVSRVLHLELLLVFIGGGFVVRNFSDYEHDLMKPVELVSLPVFVVFFTIAGASIDLATTWRILPLALTLCAVRAVAFFFSAKIGNAIGKEAEPVRDNAWLGYLPQAGVTLGLVGLASTQLPELAKPILSTGMAVVAINLLLGPITLRVALKRAGEIPSDAPEAEAAQTEEQGQEGETSPIEKLPELVRQPFYRIEHQLNHQFSEQFKTSWGRWAKNTEQEFRELAQAVFESSDRVPQLWEQVKPSKEALLSFSEECRETYLAARRAVRTLPDVVEVPLEDSNRRAIEADASGIIWKKRAASFSRTFTFVRRPLRRIPVREMGRLHFEPRLAELTATIWNSRMRLVAAVLEDFSEAIRGNVECSELEGRIARRFEGWERYVRRESQAVTQRAVRALQKQANVVDSPYLSRSRVRASGADSSIRLALAGLDESEPWLQAFEAAWSGITTIQTSNAFRGELEQVLQQSIVVPGQEAFSELALVVEKWGRGLSELEGKVEAEEGSENPELVAAVISEFEAFDQEIHATGVAAYEKAMAGFRASLDLRVLNHQVETRVEQLPAGVVLIRPNTVASAAESATMIEFRRVEPRKLAERIVLRDTLSAVERAAENAEELPRMTSRTVLGVLETTRLQVRALADEPDAQASFEGLKRTLSGGATQVTALVETLRDSEKLSFDAMAAALNDGLRELERQLELEGRSLGDLVRGRRFRLLAEGVNQRLSDSFRAAMRLVRALERGVRRAIRSELSLEVRAKFRAGDLDAGSVHEFLKRHEPHESLREYTPYFSGGPLRDASQFVAHRALLSEILSAERSWISGGPASVLVVGDPGSGRTSLLNLLQHGSFSQSLVRPSPVEWRRRVGLIQSLSYELGCRPRPGSIEKALAGRQALVIIDDLEQWIPPGVAGIETLETLLDLMARTRKTAFWAVSAGSSWFDLASSMTDVAGSFGRVTRLKPVGDEELRESIERRHENTGREFKFPTTVIGSLLSRGRPDRDRDLFFKVLARASGGNLTRALGLWLHMAHLDDEGVVRLRLSRALVVGLPFVRHLTAEQVALLVLLSRHGPLSEREVAGELRCALPLVRRQLTFLLSAGLLYEDTESDGLVRVKSGWAPFLQDALHEVKAL